MTMSGAFSAESICPNNTTTPPPRPLVSVLGGAGLLPQRAEPGRASPYYDRHPAAQRDRRAAPGPRAEQHAAGHPHPPEADAGLRDPVDAGHRPRRASPRRRSSSGGCSSEEKQDPPRPGPRRAGRADLAVEETSTKPASSASSSRWAAAATGSGRASRSTPVCARAVRHTFFGLFREQLIYRGKRLVNWDTFLQTAVSDDEVFHEAVQGPLLALPLPGDRSAAGRADARDDRHHAARDDAGRYGRGRASRPGRRAGRAPRPNSQARLADGPGQGEGRTSRPQLDDVQRRTRRRCCRSWSSSATWPCAGRKLHAAAAEPRDPAGGRRVGQARTGQRLREDHAGPRPERLRRRPARATCR